MTEFLTSYLEPILAFVTGGGLLSFLTLKYSKKQAEADAMRAIQKVYQTTIKDLQNDKEYMQKELVSMRNTVSKNSHDIAMLQRYKCTILDCSLRKTE